MPPHCEIKFHNNERGIYHSGATLSGSVELRLEEPLKLRGLKLLIKGEAKAEWTSRNSRNNSVGHYGNETLLKEEKELVNLGSKDTIELPVGVHVYNFETYISPSLPSSFESIYGDIRYIVSATIDRPWNLDQTTKADFTVLKTLDLSQASPSLRQPCVKDYNATFCCLIGSMEVTVEIPRAGYTPGETIEVTTRLKNSAKTSIDCISTKLYRQEKYTSNGGDTKINDFTLAKVQSPVPDSNDSNIVQQLQIPPVVPNTLCSVIFLSYEIQVTVKLAWYLSNPRIFIPINIGTVPLTKNPDEDPAASPSDPLLDPPSYK